MKICHITMFAPSRCGLYEASRDMFLSDRQAGHQVYMVDVGIVQDGKHVENGKIGEIDNRCESEIKTSDPSIINDMDIIIMHTGCSDNWIVKTQAPLIWVVHGRPRACFVPEDNGKSMSYSLYENISRWQRTKKMLYFWEEHKKDWQMLFNGKDLILDYPVIDQKRFNNEKTDFNFTNNAKYNFVITDTNREDIDNYEMIVSIINAIKSEKLKNLDIKFHFYGLDFPLKNCWNILLGKLKETGKLGDIENRVKNIEKVYKKAHCLISPNTIIVRTIAEAVCCDCFIIANECKIADINVDFRNINQMIYAIEQVVKGVNNKIGTNQHKKKLLSFDNYNKQMKKVYQEIT